MLAPWKKSHDKPRQCIKKQRHHFADKVIIKAMIFPVVMGKYVQMWELDHKEGWAWTKWCFWTVVLEKTLESPLDCKEIKPVNPKGKQPWMFSGKTDVEAETPILWPPDMKSQLVGKTLCWERLKAGGEGDNGGWDRQHHWFSGCELEQTLPDSKGQRSLKNYSLWNCKESDLT